MINIIGKRRLYYLISLLVIIPGLVSLWFYGLKLSIDFTGGTRMTFVSSKPIDTKTVDRVKGIIISEKAIISTVQRSDKSLIVRTTSIDEKHNTAILQKIKAEKILLTEESFETVGPTIGEETTLNALKSTALAAVLIVLYIAFSFRKVPKPASSWKFGVCTIVALLHDVLVVIGIFSLLGHFFGVEIDSLFVTAVLTVIGFSVHDTIVVFDRIRENLLRISGVPFEKIVNDSILQTLTRSLNTSITALLVLFTLLLFGGGTVHWFIFALLVGIASGTYSSIFNAAPLLVSWNEFDKKRRHA
ncbi:MAG: protein translocase subunit SecF [bacterium]|nr:protein translocase subunit SecF [bacterium]